MGNCLKVGRPANPELDDFFELERAEATADPRSRATQWLDQKRSSMFCSKGRELPIRLYGLDGSGKTKILYKLSLGEDVETIPTCGYNVETVAYRGRCLSVWDIGGRAAIRPLWRHHMRQMSCLIWVVDSTDPERLDVSRDELHRLLSEPEVKDAVVLVWANKQDVQPWLTTIQCRHRLAACLELCSQNRADSDDGIVSGLMALQCWLRQLIVLRAFNQPVGPLMNSWSNQPAREALSVDQLQLSSVCRL